MRDHTPLQAWIPLKAPSMNSLLYVIWHQKRLETKPEVRLFRSNFKSYLPPWEPEITGLYSVRFSFHADWYYKNGSLRREDAPNLIKCCLDALCERYSLEDAQVWHLSCEKVHAPERPGIEVWMEASSLGAIHHS